jgi:nucleotide-binding universal stress UspA family protein
MIRSLLVGLDASAHARSALEHAIELAKVYQARLTGVHVLDVRYLEMPPYLDYSYTFEAVPPAVVPVDIMDKFKEKSEHIVASFQEAVEKAGIEATSQVVEGVPGQVVADLAGAHDLVILGKRGEHAKWGRDLLGSTAEAVARRSATPLLLVEEQSRPVRKALVLFDGSHPANRALKLAADVASKTSMEIHVLTVEDDDEKGKAILAEAKRYLEPLGLVTSYVLLEGRVAKAAASLLGDEPVDMAILGMRGHSPLRYLILGRTAEQLMRSVQLPVLLVP